MKKIKTQQKFKQTQQGSIQFFKSSMRKNQSKPKSSLLKTKKEENQYADFLQKKLQEQQYLTHLVNIDAKTLQQQNAQLKQLVAKLRAGDKKTNKKITSLQQDKDKFQNEISKLQEQNNFLSKKIQRIQSENKKQFSTSEPIETKLVFKQFLATTFPTYKDTIKRILRFFMYIQKYEQNGKQDRIKAYNDFVKSIIQKIMLFIFPKSTQNQKSKSIAQTMVEKWRDNQTEVQKQLRKQLASLKILNSQYLGKIQSYEAEFIRLKATKNMLESKVQNYQKTLKVKASEFVVHLKKALIKKTQYDEQDEAIQQMKEIMHTLQSVVSASGQNSNEKKADNNIQSNQLLMLSNKSLPNIQIFPQALQTSQNQLSKKPLKKHPILKKNIYGYYEEPQLSTQWNFLTNTKHPDLNKYTQTLPDDLTILITHPVIVVHLFDGDVRPKRTRHNTEFYVKIHKNSQSSISSQSIDSPDYKPVWNRQYIIKNYDFPSLRVQLLNKSKGLRDKVLGEGRLSVESTESKIVPIRKQKEFQGRVRFGLHYPKGNIFQFVINSIQLVVPQNIRILTQTVQITADMNDSFVEKFSNGNLVKYLTNKSIFIIQGVDGDIQGRVINRKVFGTISFNEFTQKQGQKRVTINAEDWQIILEGYIVLIVSEQSEPERIECSQEGKYFAVRAGYPLLSANYNKSILYSHVKLPLVFNYVDEITYLQCVMQCQKMKGKTEEIMIDPLLVQGTQNTLRSHKLLSTPPHIYEFFIQTLQGPQVKFAYQSTLFVKLPDKVKLEISIEINEKDGQVDKLDPFMKKGKRKLLEKEVQKIEFFIETKDLMMNYYKTLSRTYKVTGYSKYKLGYIKIRNLLRSEGQENKKQFLHKQIKRKQISIDQPLQGEYYINCCVSKGYLPSFSSTSKYAIQLSTGNDCMRTEFMKGGLLVWQHMMLMKFTFGKGKSPEFTIKVIELPIIGSERVVYECTIPMSSNILKLGRLILNLSSDQHQLQSKSLQQYDILILSSISIPQHVYSIYVDRIEIEVEEQADWFSKIDPYIVFFANGKKVYQTIVKDGAGDNSQWDNIGFKIVLSQSSNTQTLNQMFKLKIYDQDLINDDYLGECTLIFDPQIANSDSLIQCIRSKVIKQDKVCGSIRVHGKFKKIKQNPQQILTHSFTQLSPKQHLIYHICLTEINFSNSKVLQNDQKLKISYTSRKEYKYAEKQIQYKAEQGLKNVNFSIWAAINTKQSQDDVIELRLTTQRKELFKKQLIELGSISIKKQHLTAITRVSQLNIPIVIDKNKQMGFCSILVQPIYKSNYLVIDSYSSGTELNLLARRQNDCASLLPSMKSNLDSLREQFGDVYLFEEGQQQYQMWSKKGVDIQRRVEERGVVGSDSLRQVFYLSGENSKYPLNNQCLTIYNMHKWSKQSNNRLVYTREFVSNSSLSQQNIKSTRPNRVFSIKTLNWQPVRFGSLEWHQIELKFGGCGNLSISKRQNQNINEYYVIGSCAQKNISSLVLFSQHALPYQIVIHEKDSHSNKNTFTIPLLQQQSMMICSQKYAYFQHFGAIYYQLEEYKNKYRRVYFSKLLIKICQPNILDQNQQQSLQGIKLSIEGSPLTYSATKSISNCGWLFQHMQFYMPLDSITNTVTLKFTSNNNRVQQYQSITLKGKLNQWDYFYEHTQHYILHAELIIDSDPNIPSIPLSKPSLPTQISFIQLQSLQITPTANFHNTQVKIKFSLHNQFIELKANRNNSSNDSFSYQIKEKQLLYIDQSQPSVIKVEIIQQKIFGDSVIGSGVISIQKHQLNFGYTSKFAEIVNNQRVVLGKVQVGFRPLSEVSFLYVDVDRIVPNKEYKALTVQLVPFGTDKRNIQRVNMQLLQQSPHQLSHQQHLLPISLNYNTSQDLIIAQHDYQDYTVHISDTETHQLLGKFKLCDLIKKDNDDYEQHISVIHPLRMTKVQLNGLMRVNYIESVSAKKELYDQQQLNCKQQCCVYLSLADFKFINQLSSPNISIVFQSQYGKLFTQQLNFSTTPSPIITIAFRQQQKITLFIRRHYQTALVAFAIIDVHTYIREEKQLVVFQSYLEPEVVYAICRVDIKMVDESVTMYEIVQVKARELTDMELFVDMNPYVVVQSHYQNTPNNNLSYHNRLSSTFLTQVNSGKTNLWWKLGLIIQNSFKITLFDRDLKFDDYIGQTTIFKQQLQKDFITKQYNQNKQEKPNQYNKDRITKTMRLISVEEDNKDAGVIEITIRRIVMADKLHNNIEQQALKVNSQYKGVYCVMIEGFCENPLINQATQQVTSFTISLQNGIVLYFLQAQYNSNLNIILNILNSGPILLSGFAFLIDSKKREIEQILIVDVQTKGERLRQIIRINELLSNTISKTIKFDSNQIQQQLFDNCQLIPLREALLIDRRDSQQVLSKLQQQQFAQIFLINSITLWLLYNQFDNNCITLTILIQNSSITRSRKYSMQISSYKSKLIHAKQGCLIIDLRKCLPYQIYIQSTEQIQIILTGQDYTQSIKTKLSLNNLIHNPNQHKVLIQSELSQQQTNIGLIYLELQSIYEQQASIGNNNQRITSLNNLRNKINTFNKSSLSWLEFKVKRATFDKDIEIFSKMDPYYIAEFTQFVQQKQSLKESYKSSVQQNMGTNPIWDHDRFFFCLTSKKSVFKLQINFMDEQVIKDRQLGYSKIDTENLMSSIHQIVAQREIAIFKEQSSSNEQVGTAVISYNITHSYIIFFALQSLGIDNKLMIGTIQSKDLADKMPSKLQQLLVMKPYPVSSQTYSICIHCGSQSKTIQYEQLLTNAKSQGQLCFTQHSVAIKYMFFK